MGKSRHLNKREEDLLQRLKRENSKLKRQIKSLRKQLQRVDVERYENLKDLLYKHHKEDLQERIVEERKKLKKKWECYTCGEGFMKIQLLSRRDGLFYLRVCTECGKRTKVKPYTDKVEGIKDE